MNIRERHQYKLYEKYTALLESTIPPVCRIFSEYLLSYEKSYDHHYHALLVCVVYCVYRSHVCYDTRQNPFETDETACMNENVFNQTRSFVADALKGAAKAASGKFLTSGSGDSPVICDSERFYLNKYRKYESDIADFIAKRIRHSDTNHKGSLAYLENLFKKNDTAGEGQYKAACAALSGSFTVITGGPGTGKTTTICRVLLLKVASAPVPEDYRILLLAPTGKSASRLQDSISAGLESIVSDAGIPEDLKQYAALLPRDVFTVHRYLGFLKNEYVSCNLIVIDEFSMVDIALFHNLILRCKDETSVILLGDRQQLASVQAGSVLSDISEARQLLNDRMVHLSHSYRFDPGGGIGRLAHLISNFDAGAVTSFLQSGDESLLFLDSRHGLRANLVQAYTFLLGSFDEYASYTQTSDPLEALNRISRSAILCALRKGPGGLERVNETVEALLGEKGAILPSRRLYPGMPLMITKNNYSLDVYNGDTGVITRQDGSLTLTLSGAAGKLRRVNPVLIESFEKNYAMTIHKSQGSEFDGVIIVLPEKPLPLLTRELLYTAVTRARKKVVIISSLESLEYAASRKTSRMSGLTELLVRKEAE